MAAGDARAHDGELERRCRHIALADAGADRVAVVPFLLDVGAFPLVVRNRADLPTGDAELVVVAKPELLTHLGDLLDAGAPRCFIEIAVARLRHAAAQVHPAMTFR